MFKNKKNDKPTYFITGGGTGGHIYPALAVINALINSGVDKDNIFYLGNKKNLEYEIINKNNFNFLSHSAKGMPRQFNLKLIKWCFGLFFSILKTMFYFFKYKPDVVFATGGYVCAPALFCADILNIPYVLHDCDIQPGIVTKFFSKNAKSVSVSFEGATKFIKSKNIFVNGNPIRQEFKTISKLEARKNLSIKNEFVILIMGGSLGARTINKASIGILKEYAFKNDYKIIWQTGKKNFDDVISVVLNEFKELPDNVIIQPYYDKMYIVMLASDVVISRAGSLSLSEICASSLPSILIPYPYASADHQKKNAQNLVENNIALMLEDKDCNSKTLVKTLDELINDKEKLYNFSHNAYANAKLDSAQRIVEQIKEAMKR